jgi:hypothetical protein
LFSINERARIMYTNGNQKVPVRLTPIDRKIMKFSIGYSEPTEKFGNRQDKIVSLSGYRQKKHQISLCVKLISIEKLV